MESKKEKIFPWINDVLQSFATSLMVDYDSDVLSILHRNIDKEIKMIYSSSDQTIERTEALYKEITYIYEHMRLKISQHPEFQNATLSCVRLISQLIRVGLILTQGLINSEWIERILTALKLFPGEKVLVYDALLLVNGLKKIHQKPYSAILRHIMTEDHHEFVTDPLVYMEIILLFRRLKALVLNRYKEKYNILVTKIKPPSNLISWLVSLDANGYFPYLRNLKYKKIAQQLMKKALPESFIKMIRYMALNQYNFEIDGSEFKIIETKNQPSCMFTIDNTSSTKCDNLDMLENSQKAIMKKKIKSQTRRKRKKLQLNENIENCENPQSNNENNNSNICINESGIDNNHKHFSNSNKHAVMSKKKQKSNLSNSNEQIIVSKKKKKSKCNLVKNAESKTSAILSKDISDSDLFFQDDEGSTLLHDIDGSTLLQVNKSTLNEEDPESSNENKISILYVNECDRDIASDKHSNSNEHLTVSKKKKKLKSKKNLVKNSKLRASATLNKGVPDSDLFFHDDEGSTLLHDIDGSTLLQVNKSTLNEEDPESSNENEISILYVNESDRDIASDKHSNSNEHLTVSKKKKKLKSKKTLVKNSKLRASATLNKGVPDSDLFFHDVISEQLNKNTLTDKRPESSSENKIGNVNIDKSDTDKTIPKHVPISNERIIVSKKNKKSKCNLIKNPESEPSSIHSENVPDSVLFFLDVAGSNNSSNKPKTTYNISNFNISTKRDLSEDTDATGKNVSKKNSKKLKSSKYNERTIFDNSLSSDNKLDSSIVSHQQLMSENIDNKQENSLKDDEDIMFVTEISGEKRKKITSKDDTASDDKCVYFKKLMLKKVSDTSRTTSTKISNEEENINSAVTMDEHSKLLDIKEKNKNVFVSITKNTVCENQSVHLENVANKSFEEERNAICNIPSACGDTFNDSIHLKNIGNLSTEKENNLIVQSSEKTKLFIEPKVAGESSTLETITQTTNESNKNVVDNLNSEWGKEDNLIKNKKSDVLLHKSDISIASVSSVECKDIENKHNMKESGEPLRSNLISNEESRSSSEYPIVENISVPSQSLNAINNDNNIHEKDMHSNQCTFDISNCADISSTAKGIANQIKKISDQNTHICVAASNVSIDSSSCENSDIAKHNENFNNLSVEKTYSTTLDESSFKADFKPVNTQVRLEHENQKYISSVHDNILPHPSPSGSMQSEDQSLLDDSITKNVVNNECSVENSSVIESETKLELKEISSENICSNESFDKARLKDIDKDTTLIDEVSEDNILHSVDQQDKSLQNNVNIKLNLEKDIDTVTDVAEDSENCEHKTECVETTLVQPQDHYVCFDNEKVEESCVFKENSLKCESSKDLNIESEFLITKVSILDTQKKHGEVSKNVSIKIDREDKVVPELENVKNANQKCVEKRTEFEVAQKTLHPNKNKEVGDHVEDNAGHSVISIVKQEKNSEGKDAQALDKLNDVEISSMLVNEAYVHENSDQSKTIDSQSDIISKKNNEIIESNKSILVLNESACLDTISNSVNDVKISAKKKEDTLQVLIESEKVPDLCDNSEKTNVVNSQSDIINDNKNNNRNLSNKIILSSNESACSDSIGNSTDNVKTSKKAQLQSLLESKNVAITCENSDKLKVVNSQDDIIISNKNNEKDLSNENIPTSYECSDKINNSANDGKTSTEIMESTIHSLLLIEKPIDACENSDTLNVINSQDDSILHNENSVKNSSNENISPLKESTCSDNICNSENDIKIVKSTIHLLSVIENPNGACENSDQLKTATSEDGSIIRNERNLSTENISSLKESTSSEKIDNSANEAIHLLLVSEKPIDACKNSDQSKVVNSQNDRLIDNKNSERNLSNENISFLKEFTSSDNIANPANVKIVESTNHLLPVIEKPIDACENSDQLKTVTSQDDSLIDNERNISTENISSVKELTSSDNIGNPANEAIHLLSVSEKPIDACENSDQSKVVNSQNDSLIDNKSSERNLSNENISSLKESTSSDNIANPANNVKNVESTNHLLPVIEKPIDACENSDQLKTVTSQDDSLIGNERNISTENISSVEESTSSDNIANPANNVKNVESTNHLLPVIEKPIDACENSDQLKTVTSQDDSLIGNERNISTENISSVEESTNSDNIVNSSNEVKIVESTIHLLPVIENEKSIDACENSDELKAVYSENNSIIDNERDLLTENIPSSKECSVNINNSANDVKVSGEIMKNTIHSLTVIEKPNVADENFDKLKAFNSQVDNIIGNENNERDISNISSPKESTSSDNMPNSENHVKISVEIINSTIPSLSVIEKPTNTCENSDQLNVVDSQIDSIGNGENIEKDLSNENDVASSAKEKEDTLQLSLKSKNLEETPLNIENSSSAKSATEINCNLHCIDSNFNELGKSCERVSIDSEKDADCNLDFREPYIVLDESYSDVDDCKSNFSEQSIENSSPLKKAATATNEEKFKDDLSSSDPSLKPLCEKYNEQIEPIVKENTSEVALKKGTSEMDSNISPIKIDATNKYKIKSDISSSNDNNNHLHENDTSEVSHGDCTNDIDNATSPVNVAGASESKLKGDISSSEGCHKHLCEKDDPQIEPILKKDTSEVSHENYTSKIDSKNPRESNLSNIKKDLSLIANAIEHSLDDNNSRKKFISASVVQSRCSSSVLETESSKKHEIKFAEKKEQIIKRMKRKNSIKYPSEVPESLSIPSFYDDKNRESFTEFSFKNKDKNIDIESVGSVPIKKFPSNASTESFSMYRNELINGEYDKMRASLSSRDQSFREISFENKDKNIDIESVGSVPINNFSSAASTELFSMYRNELTNDEDNKTEASSSSRDGLFPNCQENDEIKSQTFSSDHSDDDRDSRSSSQEEEKESSAEDTVIPSEDCNDQSKTIDESLSFKNDVSSTTETEKDSLDNKNCSKDKSLSGLNVTDSLDNAHEKNVDISVLPRQSPRLKTKTESKCQTDSEEISSDISKIQEVSKKELKLVLTDCKSSLKSENNINLCSSVENVSSSPLTHNNNEDITSSRTSVIKKKPSTAKDKSDKRYSLRHRKSRDDSANLGIDLNKLKFDSPSSSKCTRSSRRESKYVKMLTSPSDDIKLKDNPSDVLPSKRETHSSTAKSDGGIEPNTPSYNLRNRKTIIAPPKFNV